MILGSEKREMALAKVDDFVSNGVTEHRIWDVRSDHICDLRCEKWVGNTYLDPELRAGNKERYEIG